MAGVMPSLLRVVSAALSLLSPIIGRRKPGGVGSFLPFPGREPMLSLSRARVIAT